MDRYRIMEKPLQSKKCPKCGETKPFGEYHRSNRRPPHFLQSHCKSCQNNKKYKRTSEFYKKHDLKRNYGITVEEYEDMLVQQDNLCAICHKPETITSPVNGQVIKLSVDHDHTTGEIRGLLCANCNNGLGRFKDSPKRLRSALSYLGA